MHIPRMEQSKPPATALAKWMVDTRKSDDDIVQALAERGVKIGRSQVNRLRNGNSDPSFKTAKTLEEITLIPATTLFGPPQADAA